MMPDEEHEAEQNSRGLTATIVTAFLAGNQVATAEIPTVISTVHQALAGLGKPPEPAVERTPAVPIRRSVGPDFIICIECGYRGKALRRHLRSRHGLTVNEYRQRWDLKPDHPMVAPAYSAQRSALAKQLGLGRKRQPEPESSAPQPKTRRRRRSKAA